MVVGVPPREASDRLVIYQVRTCTHVHICLQFDTLSSLSQTTFDELWRRYQTYSGGEDLFGLPVTSYPDIVRIRKELNLLQKLYGLYNIVMDSIDGYYDIPWSEVDIEKINNELMDFQNKCRKLPKALKEWQAFNDLKTKIDDFNETCPLLERMLDRSMKERHWKRIEEVTKWKFEVESEGFLLRHVMEAPLLKNMEDIEVGCHPLVSACGKKLTEFSSSSISRLPISGYLYQCRQGTRH